MIDRDDTLIRDVPEIGSPDQIELLPSAAEGIEVLGRAGLWLALVTNQGVIARGVTARADVDRVNQRLSEVLAEATGFGFDSVHICPHHPTVGVPCDCRKPGTGMLTAAIDAATAASIADPAAGATDPDTDSASGKGSFDTGPNSASSLPAWMIGNSATDMLAALRLGVGAVLVLSPDRRDQTTATDILASVERGRQPGDLPTASIVVVESFVEAARLVAAEVAA